MINKKHLKKENYKVLAKEFYKIRNIIKARYYYEKAYSLLNGRDDSELILDMALFYDEIGEEQLAEERFRELIALTPKDERGYYGLAIIYDNNEKYDLAIEYYKKAIELNPNYNRAYFFLACVYDEIGESLLAEECYKKVLELNPKDFWANLNLSSIYEMRKEYKKALEYINIALEIDSENYMALFNKAVIINNLGFSEEAIRYYEKSLKDNKFYPYTYLNLAVIHREKKDFNSAVDIISKGIKYNPEEGFLYYNRACYFVNLNKYDEALNDLKKAIGFYEGFKKYILEDDELESIFNTTLDKILKNVAEVLNGASPAVIWSGNGYHLLLPVDISEPLEAESAFLKYTDQPSRDFLRFAEQYLSIGKSDQQHYSMVSFKTYLARVPGSLNSKCLNSGISEEDSRVKLIQKWNGIKPAIKGSKLLREFYKYLADRHVKEKKEQYRHSKRLQRHHRQQQQWWGRDSTNNNKDSSWFERLLQTPISDCRKNAIDLILSRYLVNVKHLSVEDSYAIIRDWLDKCKSVAPLEKGFDYDYRIRFDLRNAIKSGRLPMSKEQLREKMPTLYHTLFGNN